MINEIIGWIGNILFAICGIPQVIKTFRSKSAKDLSLLFLWLWFSGELLTFYLHLNRRFGNRRLSFSAVF